MFFLAQELWRLVRDSLSGNICSSLTSSLNDISFSSRADNSLGNDVVYDGIFGRKAEEDKEKDEEGCRVSVTGDVAEKDRAAKED